MKTRIKHQLQQLQQGLLIVLIVGILFQTYHQSWLNTQRSSPFVMNYAHAVSIAISELAYGSAQGIGYIKIYNLFRPLFRAVDWGPEFSIVNKTIEQALNIEQVDSDGIHSTNYEGLSTYYRIAFLIFGYKAESAFFLYWLLLATSVLIFCITFYKNPILLFYLLLFACALFAISQTQGVLLESLIRNRFLSIPTILPTFYLILIIAGEHKRDWLTIVGTIGQTLILVLMVYVRPSSLYQFLFLGGTTAILVILHYVKPALLNLNQASTVQFWPLIIVLIGYLLFRLNTLNPVFPNSLTNRSCTWHMYYMGLAGHPASKEKYGITRDDAVVFELIARKAPEWGYNYNSDVSNIQYSLVAGLPTVSEKEIDTCDPIYEQLVKDEFFKIFKQDPWFVISSYLHKIYLYFYVYFNSLNGTIIKAVYANPAQLPILDYNAFGVVDQLIAWPIVVALAIAIFLIEPIFLKKWLFSLLVLSFGFFCAFLIPLLYYPINNTITDSALYLTIIWLAIISAGTCYGLRLIERFWSTSKVFKLAYISLIILLLVGILRGVFGYRPFKTDQNQVAYPVSFYRQPADEVFQQYGGFNIVRYQDRYYALVHLGQVDPTDEDTLAECQTQRQCAVGDSYEEVKQQVDMLLSPQLMAENYKGFNIFQYKDKFYALAQTLGTVDLTQFDEAQLNQYQAFCAESSQCGMADSLEAAKQWIDQLP